MRPLFKVLRHCGFTVFVSVALVQIATAQILSNSVAIKIQGNGSVSVRFQGTPGGPSEIQSSDSLVLPFWQILADQTADTNGFISFTDTNGAAISRFYRQTAPTTAPMATNTDMAGNENDMIPAILGGTDPANPTNTLKAIITSLPALGTIYQFDNTVISNVPALVKDSQNRMLYQGASDDIGTNYASFNYVVRRDSDGVASIPSRVQVDLAFVPYPPVATTPDPSLLENTSIIFQLTYTDRNLKHGPDAIRAVIGDSTVRGELRQVLNDNVTPGDLITGETLVSNTNNLLYYTPPAFGYGYNFDSFDYLFVNSFSQQSPLTTLPINVIHVDQPIYASPTTFTIDPSASSATVQPSVTSADNYPITLYFTNMPQNGSLYVSSVAPGNLITPAHNGFDPYSQFIFVRQHAGECGVTNDTGFPYAVLGYVISNTVGKTASATITINVPPAPAPPYLTAPTNYTLLGNSNLTFSITGASPETNSLVAIIEALPQHGSLYWSRSGRFMLLTAAPVYYNTNAPLMYVPATNYFGPDSIPVTLQDPAGNTTCDGTNFGPNQISFTVQEVNQPPSIRPGSGFFTVLIYDDSGNVTSTVPAVLEAAVSDPDALPTDVERVTIRALNGSLPADGQISLLTTNGLANLQFTSPVECSFEGTLSNLNAVLNNQFQYTPTGGVTDADSVLVIINDEGHNGVVNNPLQASATLSISYVYQGGGDIP